VEKTKQTYVLPFLEEWYFTLASFDFWKSKGATIHDFLPLLQLFWDLIERKGI
jgi:hypothetical protein